MSAIQFLTSGGMASTCEKLSVDNIKIANEIVKKFGEKVKIIGLSLKIPASFLKVRQSTFLLIGKDVSDYYFVFADSPGGTFINYQDFTAYNNINLQILVSQVKLEIGEVSWSFSCPVNVSSDNIDNYINEIAVKYMDFVRFSQKNQNQKISEEAISLPEIAPGVKKFRADYPIGERTAFIIMQFGDTDLHKSIVACVKDTLKKHEITALRADDKQYSDDLFPNIKTYMHACDFGVAIFDRITEDDFNPNVSLEVGYMLGLGKNVLLLKDATLKSLQTDLTGKLYKPFNTIDVDHTMPQQIEKWLADKGLVRGAT